MVHPQRDCPAVLSELFKQVELRRHPGLKTLQLYLGKVHCRAASFIFLFAVVFGCSRLSETDRQSHVVLVETTEYSKTETRLIALMIQVGCMVLHS